MKATRQSEESRTILGLRRQIRQQDNLIEDLQKTNSELQVELNIEKGLTRMYIDRLRQTEEEWLRQMRTLKGFVQDVHQMLTAHDGSRSEMSTVFCAADLNAYFEDAISSECTEEDLHSANILTTSLSTANTKEEDLNADNVSTQLSSNDSCEICDEQRIPTYQQRTSSPTLLSSDTNLCNTIPRALFQTLGHSQGDKVGEINTHRKPLVKNRGSRKPGFAHFLYSPRQDWAQRLLLIKESFEKKKTLFVDDLSFIREVHGGFSLAPEMDIELEFKNLSKTFSLWKSEFKEQLRMTEIQIKQAVKSRGFPTRKHN